MFGMSGACYWFRALESSGKNLVLARGSSVFEGNEHDEIAVLLGRAIPRTMEGNEGTISVFLGKHISRIKQQVIGPDMTGKAKLRHGFVCATLHFLFVAAVVGAEQALSFDMVEIAIGPSEVGPFGDSQKLL